MRLMNKEMCGLAALIAAIMLFVTSCQTVGGPRKTPLIDWRTLEQGTEEAKERGMPMLVDFYYGVTCMRCEHFDRDLYSDPQVADAINKNFIPVRVYLTRKRTEAEAALLWKLSPTQECALAFLNKNGKIITDAEGRPLSSMEVLSKAEYLAYMKEALKNSR